MHEYVLFVCVCVCVCRGEGVTCCLNHRSSFALGDLFPPVLCFVLYFAFPVIIISTRMFQGSPESI